MLNQKLTAISKLVKKNDIVIDIGCDHAYLAIYLKENNLCKEVYASDISENVINTAQNNIKKAKVDIKTYLSDGFKNIQNNSIDTAIISGMGTNTILNIVSGAPKNIIKYIISSNNNHEELRIKMLEKGFYIQEEIVIKEKDKYYPIMLFEQVKTKETKLTLKYGKSNNKDYFNYLIKKEKDILNNISKKHIITRLKHLKNIFELKKLIKRS